MPGDHSIAATFPSSADARREASALVRLFRDHAKQHVRYDRKPSKAMAAYGERHGKTWRDVLEWGDEGLVGDEPTVQALDDLLFVFHVHWHRNADLPKLLAAAGARTVTAAEGPPVVRVELTFQPGAKGARLRSALDALFAQREEPHLCDWQMPGWATRELLGESDDVWVVHDDASCTFTLPLHPADLPAFTKVLAAGSRDLKVGSATARDVAALKKRELAKVATAAKATGAGAAKAKASAPAAEPPAKAAPIPKTPPTVQRLSKGKDDFTPGNFASNGAALYAMGFAGIHHVDPKKGADKGKDVGQKFDRERKAPEGSPSARTSAPTTARSGSQATGECNEASTAARRWRCSRCPTTRRARRCCTRSRATIAACSGWAATRVGSSRAPTGSVSSPLRGSARPGSTGSRRRHSASSSSPTRARSACARRGVSPTPASRQPER